MTARILLSASACVLCACMSMTSQDAPALIVEPSAAGHGDLVSVVSAAFNVANLAIADDALTRESVLIIERQPARDSTGQRMSGRDFGTPEQFQLVRGTEGCVLIQHSTGRRHVLTKVRCKPA